MLLLLALLLLVPLLLAPLLLALLLLARLLIALLLIALQWSFVVNLLAGPGPCPACPSRDQGRGSANETLRRDKVLGPAQGGQNCRYQNCESCQVPPKKGQPQSFFSNQPLLLVSILVSSCASLLSLIPPATTRWRKRVQLSKQN